MSVATNISTFVGTVEDSWRNNEVVASDIRSQLIANGYGVLSVLVSNHSGMIFTATRPVTIRMTTVCGHNKNQIAANIGAIVGGSFRFDHADRECGSASEGIGGGQNHSQIYGNDYVYQAGNLATVTVSASDGDENEGGMFDDLIKWFTEHQTEAMMAAGLVLILLIRK